MSQNEIQKLYQQHVNISLSPLSFSQWHEIYKENKIIKECGFARVKEPVFICKRCEKPKIESRYSLSNGYRRHVCKDCMSKELGENQRKKRKRLKNVSK